MIEQEHTAMRSHQGLCEKNYSLTNVYIWIAFNFAADLDLNPALFQSCVSGFFLLDTTFQNDAEQDLPHKF
jgi:hypothetical protein